jgi:hypothetical protein
MGYLVNVAISTVTDAILAQQDITEEESNHLNELLRTLHPLEELFVLEAGQVCRPVLGFVYPLINSHPVLLSTFTAGSSFAISPNCL